MLPNGSIGRSLISSIRLADAMDLATFLTVLSPLLCYVWWWVALTFVRIGQAQHASANNASYNNKDPRSQQAQLEGLGRRAVNTMNNHAEGFAFFATAVVLNIALRGPENGSTEVAITALAHAGFRLGHCVAYLLDIDIIRSLCFFLGIVANFVLYAFALSA